MRMLSVLLVSVLALSLVSCSHNLGDKRQYMVRCKVKDGSDLVTLPSVVMLPASSKNEPNEVYRSVLDRSPSDKLNRELSYRSEKLKGQFFVSGHYSEWRKAKGADAYRVSSRVETRTEFSRIPIDGRTYEVRTINGKSLLFNIPWYEDGKTLSKPSGVEEITAIQAQ